MDFEFDGVKGKIEVRKEAPQGSAFPRGGEGAVSPPEHEVYYACGGHDANRRLQAKTEEAALEEIKDLIGKKAWR